MARVPDGLAVRFGEKEIADHRVEGEVNNVFNDASTARVVIPNDLLMDADPDYRATVELYAVYGTDHEVLYTGFVDKVSPEGSHTCVDLVTQTQFMSEISTGGLGIGNVDAREMMWALSVLGGYAPDKVEVVGWEPGPLEVFEVATAIDGIELTEPVTFGGVTLYSGGPVSKLANGLGPAELLERYAEAPAWTMVLTTARTLYEAEIEGLRQIDVVLAWLTAKAQYSGVSVPGQGPRTFSREWTLSRIFRRNVVVAHGAETGRRWLRAVEGARIRPQLPLSEIHDIGVPKLPNELPVQVGEAISSWRRAAEDRDPLSSIVALWEAVEFYASGAKARKIFEKAELKSIRKKATEGLEGEQLERVRDMLARINEPPLMVRLRAALKEDDVPYVEEEISLLQKVRRARNDLVHGRSREAPSEADLKYAVAIVNRMLLYRVARLNVAMEGVRPREVVVSETPVSLMKRLAGRA